MKIWAEASSPPRKGNDITIFEFLGHGFGSSGHVLKNGRMVAILEEIHKVLMTGFCIEVSRGTSSQ